MLRTILNAAGTMLIFAGLTLLIGTAGAADCDLIGLSTIVIRCSIALAGMILGGMVKGIGESYEC